MRPVWDLDNLHTASPQVVMTGTIMSCFVNSRVVMGVVLSCIQPLGTPMSLYFG